MRCLLLLLCGAEGDGLAKGDEGSHFQSSPGQKGGMQVCLLLPKASRTGCRKMRELFGAAGGNPREEKKGGFGGNFRSFFICAFTTC